MSLFTRLTKIAKAITTAINKIKKFFNIPSFSWGRKKPAENQMPNIPIRDKEPSEASMVYDPPQAPSRQIKVQKNSAPFIEQEQLTQAWENAKKSNNITYFLGEHPEAKIIARRDRNVSAHQSALISLRR